MSRVPFLNDLQAELERTTLASMGAPVRSPRGVLAAVVAFSVVILAGAVLWLVRAPEDVAAPTTTTTTAVVVVADLPTEWARVPDEAVHPSASNFVFSRVTRGAEGFLAVGNEPGESGKRNGMVLISEGGVEWTRIDNGSTFEGVGLEAVAHAGDVTVVAGFEPDLGAVFYTSADGTTWDGVPVEASSDLQGVIPHAMASHDDGFIAVGSGLTGDGPDSTETGIVWIIDAEGTWREAVAPEFAASSLDDVVVVDGVMFVVGLSQIAEGQSEPTVWTSDDGGASWSVALLPRIEEQGFAGASSLATSGGRWVAVGFEGNAGAVWISDDGAIWERYVPKGDEFSAEKLPTRMYDVLVTNQGIVVIGAEFLGADMGRITWVSPDGRDWTRLRFEDPVSIKGASSVAYSLATDLGTIVAVGAEIAIEGDSLGSVWMSPPAAGMVPLVPVVPTEPEESDDGTADPDEALPEGWLRLGIDAMVAEGDEDVDGEWVDASLNPFLLPNAADIARLVVPGAYRLDAATGELTPWIVERIPRLGDGVDVSDDGTVTVAGTTLLGKKLRPFLARWTGEGWSVVTSRAFGRDALMTGLDGDPLASGWAVARDIRSGAVVQGCQAAAPTEAALGDLSAEAADARDEAPGATHLAETQPAAHRNLQPATQLPVVAAGGVRIVDRAKAAGLPDTTPTYGAVIDDFDGDGLDDIFLGRHSQPATLYIDGGATYEPTATSFGVGDRHGCAASDVDGSGLPDLYCTFGGARGLGVRANQLWLDPGGPSPRIDPGAGQVTEMLGRGRAATFLDYDDDGQEDLVIGQVANRLDGLPSVNRVYRWSDTGQFAPVIRSGIAPGIGTQTFDTGDVDRDGRTDLLMVYDDPKASGRTSGLKLYRNTETGLEPIHSTSGITPISERDAELARLDRNQSLDLVQLSEDRIRVSLQRDGRFRKVYERTITEAVAVAAGDADGDGDNDLYVLRQKDRSTVNDIILFNRGNGRSFKAVEAPSRMGGTADDVFPIDHDQNGLTDFLVLNGRGSAGPVQLIAFYRR